MTQVLRCTTLCAVLDYSSTPQGKDVANDANDTLFPGKFYNGVIVYAEISTIQQQYDTVQQSSNGKSAKVKVDVCVSPKKYPGNIPLLCTLVLGMQAQREGRARERLHVSCATTIQRVWRGRCGSGYTHRSLELLMSVPQYAPYDIAYCCVCQNVGASNAPRGAESFCTIPAWFVLARQSIHHTVFSELVHNCPLCCYCGTCRMTHRDRSRRSPRSEGSAGFGVVLPFFRERWPCRGTQQHIPAQLCVRRVFEVQQCLSAGLEKSSWMFFGSLWWDYVVVCALPLVTQPLLKPKLFFYAKLASLHYTSIPEKHVQVVRGKMATRRA